MKLVHRPEGLVQIGLQVRVVQVQDEDGFAAERPAACVGLLQHSRRTEAAPRPDVLLTHGHRLKGMQKVSGTKKKKRKDSENEEQGFVNWLTGITGDDLVETLSLNADNNGSH